MTSMDKSKKTKETNKSIVESMDHETLAALNDKLSDAQARTAFEDRYNAYLQYVANRTHVNVSDLRNAYDNDKEGLCEKFNYLYKNNMFDVCVELFNACTIYPVVTYMMLTALVNSGPAPAAVCAVVASAVGIRGAFNRNTELKQTIGDVVRRSITSAANPSPT